MMISGLGRIEF